jgi:hypothetical protein
VIRELTGTGTPPFVATAPTDAASARGCRGTLFDQVRMRKPCHGGGRGKLI